MICTAVLINMRRVTMIRSPSESFRISIEVFTKTSGSAIKINLPIGKTHQNTSGCIYPSKHSYPNEHSGQPLWQSGQVKAVFGARRQNRLARVVNTPPRERSIRQRLAPVRGCELFCSHGVFLVLFGFPFFLCSSFVVVFILFFCSFCGASSPEIKREESLG